MLEYTPAGQLIAFISIGMALMSALVRHAVIDQAKFKEQKENIKQLQAKMKDAQKKKDTKGMQKHQKDMMAASMDQMRHGMKPMIFTMIPFLLVFGWLRGTYGDVGTLSNVTIEDPLPAGVSFVGIEPQEGCRYIQPVNSVTCNFDKLKAEAKGEYKITYTGEPPGNPGPPLAVEYVQPNGTVEDGVAGQLRLMRTPYSGSESGHVLSYENTGSDKVGGLFGFRLGWFGWYIICSMVSSILFNKLLRTT